MAHTLPALTTSATNLSINIDELDAAIKTLAEAVVPLQGASERFGRMVDRMPSRKRNRP